MDKPHKRLDVWRHSMSLVRDIYLATDGFPKSERYGLVSQMRRAAVSVASNLAEGAARGGPRELRKFSIIARASLSELDTQTDIALMLDFIKKENREQLDERMLRIDRMLYRLIEKC